MRARRATCKIKKRREPVSFPPALFQEVKAMISVWWLIPAFFAGTAAGLLVLALCHVAYRGDDDEKE